MRTQFVLAVRVTLCAAAVSSAHAQQTEQALPEVIVTATPFGDSEAAQILAPAKILSGDELRNKLGSSLGDTLQTELGVSASSFGAGASRPIIRGLGGPRIKILQNGMGVSDVSTISEDHAVGTGPSTARQIEILRGPASLLYGSGAIGGLVNVVNERIPTRLDERPTGETEVRFGSADRSKSFSLSADGSSGKVAVHVDGNALNASDYKIPEAAELNDPDSARGRLPLSFTRQNSIGFGTSYIEDWGHIGFSIGSFANRYGIPSREGAVIDLDQMQYDTELLVKHPFAGIESARVKLAHTDYEHTEFTPEGEPEVNFSNRSFETRWEMTHQPLDGWRGTFGMQTEHGNFSATGAEPDEPATVPNTRSRSVAAFLVEEKEFGPLRLNAGLRLESAKREPILGQDRSFNLTSYSVGGFWTFAPGYGFGPTFSIAQRAPSIEELYSGGPHHATETFDIGDETLNKETSRNIELSLQKTEGKIRWRTNAFYNHVRNFIYGRLTGNAFDHEGNPGDELNERIFTQADATLRGIEAEISYNLRGEGISARAFADTSRGKLDNASSLPLQPATRFGMEAGYKQGAWYAGTSVLHAKQQNRLAAFETSTPSYTRVDANFSYTQNYGPARVTLFAALRNLLDEDIRLSTSLLKDVAPQPGRSLIVGIRSSF
jgi:iron complex outermembrane receptor protein